MIDAELEIPALSSAMWMTILFWPSWRFWQAMAICALSIWNVSCSSISIQSTLSWKHGSVTIPDSKFCVSQGDIEFYQVIITSLLMPNQTNSSSSCVCESVITPFVFETDSRSTWTHDLALCIMRLAASVVKRPPVLLVNSLDLCAIKLLGKIDNLLFYL